MLLALLSDSPPVTAPTVVLQPELHLRTSTGSA
jgi:hypothetical protein